MLMMLGRMDGKLDNVLQQLTALTNKTEDHEQRINTLEQSQGERRQQVKIFERMILDVDDLKSWRSEFKGGAKGIGLGWKIGTALFGALAGIAGMLGIQSVATHKPVAKAEMTIERSIQLPAPVNAP
jgi:hypothetical protein